MAETGDLLMSAARALRRRHFEALREWEVTPGQARALRIVHELRAARLSVLAERLHIAPRSATEVVDTLESHELVRRESDPTDRRAVTVSVTAEGLRRLTGIEEARRHASADFFADLPAVDRSELERILGLLD